MNKIGKHAAPESERLYNSTFKRPESGMKRGGPIAAVGAVKSRKRARENAFKAGIRKRDNRMCQKCGDRGTDVHHLFPVGSHIELEFTEENVLLLCRWCHRLDNDSAHADMTAFRRWAHKEFPRFATLYDPKTDRPIFQGDR